MRKLPSHQVHRTLATQLAKLAVLGLAWGTFVISPELCHAGESNLVIHEAVENHPVQAKLSLSLISLNSSTATTKSISGSDFGVGVDYYFHPKWSLGLAYHQAFSSLSFAAAYSAVEVTATYSITGTHTQSTRKVRLGDTLVYTENGGELGGLKASASFSQFFFNGTSGIYPYSGLGLGFYYELNWLRPIGLRLGARGDTTTNGSGSIMLIQGVAQFLFPL